MGKTDSDTDDVRLVVKVLDNFNPVPERANPDMKYSRIANGDWEEVYCYYQEGFYDADGNPVGGSLPPKSGRSDYKLHKFGSLSFRGELPEKGTVIRITSWSPLYPGAAFEQKLEKADFNNTELAKNNIDKISVFPNPYFASNDNETDKYSRFVRFIGLPKNVTIRIYSLSGVFVQRLEKSDNSQFMDWNLLNKDNLPVASGIYLAYVDMPGVGTKIMKLAIIQEQQYIDRL